MSIWKRIGAALSALVEGEPLSAVFEKLTTPPEYTVGFTIAVIALGAKMAKADGRVTRDEVVAFRQVFQISPRDEVQAARVFNLARQDVAGYEAYAEKILRLFGTDHQTLLDVLEGLFHISMADGHYHSLEDDFIAEVAKRFHVPDHVFKCMRARYVPGAAPDPYTVLDASPKMALDTIRKHWKRMVRESHPDAMIARGLPEEAIALATTRLVAINKAWEDIQRKHEVA